MSRSGKPKTKSTAPSEAEILEEVRQRAYELYLARGEGCSEGDDMRDWLTAEAEVRKKHAAQTES